MIMIIVFTILIFTQSLNIELWHLPALFICTICSV